MHTSHYGNLVLFQDMYVFDKKVNRQKGQRRNVLVLFQDMYVFDKKVNAEMFSVYTFIQHLSIAASLPRIFLSLYTSVHRGESRVYLFILSISKFIYINKRKGNITFYVWNPKTVEGI